MAYRNGNYAAFYVDEPFNENNLGAHSTKDFVSYNLLRTWKGGDSTFPFIDSHAKTYDVRDDSDWEKTLKPRIHARLDNSKNIVLFLSSITKNSRALREEITFGAGDGGLPVIVVYPEYSEKGDLLNSSSGNLKQSVKNLWNKVPAFRNVIGEVPTLHVPIKKLYIRKALDDTDLMVASKGDPGTFYFP